MTVSAGVLDKSDNRRSLKRIAGSFFSRAGRGSPARACVCFSCRRRLPGEKITGYDARQCPFAGAETIVVADGRGGERKKKK